MLPNVRKKRILEEVKSQGVAQVAELAELLGVSSMTVRRDLTELDEQGLLNRIHGGAQATTSSLEPSFTEKMGLQANEKSLIAQQAVNMVRSGQVISFSGGTTCLRIAQAISANEELTDLTIITNSLPVADEFFVHRSLQHHLPRVLLTGGQRTLSDALVGPVAESSLENLYSDVLFIGAHGATEAGLMTPNLKEAETNRKLIRNAQKVIAAFDGTKWGLSGLSRFAQWSSIHSVITTQQIPDASLLFLHDHVEEVFVVS